MWSFVRNNMNGFLDSKPSLYSLGKEVSGSCVYIWNLFIVNFAVVCFIPLCPFVKYGHTRNHLKSVIHRLRPMFDPDCVEWVYDEFNCKVDSLFRCLQFVVRLLDGATLDNVKCAYQWRTSWFKFLSLQFELILKILYSTFTFVYNFINFLFRINFKHFLTSKYLFKIHQFV